MNWIVKNKIETVTSYILTPYPGTAFYKSMEKQGRITSTNLSKYNTAHVVFQPAQITPEKLYNGYIWFYKNIYSFRNIIARTPKSKNQVLAYYAFNIFYRKFGYFGEVVSKYLK